jgi:hypothetical protein
MTTTVLELEPCGRAAGKRGEILARELRKGGGGPKLQLALRGRDVRAWPWQPRGAAERLVGEGVAHDADVRLLADLGDRGGRSCARAPRRAPPRQSASGMKYHEASSAGVPTSSSAITQLSLPSCQTRDRRCGRARWACPWPRTSAASR